MRHAGLELRAYQRGLSELKATLTAAILDFDFKRAGYSNYAQRLHKLEVANARIQVLRRLGSAYTANAEARNWLMVALELERWDVALALIGPQLNWAALSGEKGTYDRLQQERKRLRMLQEAIEAAEEADDQVTIVFARSAAAHPELRSMIDEALERLGPVMLENQTFTLQDVALRLRKKALQVKTNYSEALRICDEYDRLQSAYPAFDNRIRRARNALSRLLCLVQSKRYDDAEREMEASSQYFNEETQNWYTRKEWHCMLLMRRRRFEEAYALVQDVKSRVRFGTHSSSTQDRWHLFEIYAQLFTNRPFPGERRMPKERTGDIARGLLHHFPSFTEDYAGYRMSAIILEILILFLRRRDHATLIDRVESLKTFKSRHLPEESPSRAFIAMVQLLIEFDFEKSKIAPHAEPYLKIILESEIGDELMESQVFAYDEIWDYIMGAMPEVGKLFSDEEEGDLVSPASEFMLEEE